MKSPRNHYDNLKVARTASAAEIRKAYRRLASLHHPDRNGGSAESVKAMQCINRAYEVLSDERLRAAHDAWIDACGAEYNHRPKQESQSHRNDEEAKPQPQASWSEEQEQDFRAYDSLFGGGFDFMYAGWGHPDPTLKAEERPPEFDEKHLDEFIKYNDTMRKHFRGLRLGYLTPELIYRAFLIDKQWSRQAPKNIAAAYKAINRAIDRSEDDRIDKLAGFYSGLAPGIQGAVVASAFFLFIVAPAYWVIGG